MGRKSYIPPNIVFFFFCFDLSSYLQNVKATRAVMERHVWMDRMATIRVCVQGHGMDKTATWNC